MSAGDASPASVADRFFFALQPDEYAASQADRFRQRLGQELGLAGTPVRPEHLHVGLLPLSGMPVLPAQAVARAAEVISSLRVAPFEVEFDEVACQAIGLECDQALVLVGNRGSGQMVTLQRQLAQAMAHAKLDAGTSPCVPHMTLMRDLGGSLVPRRIRPISWTVRELVLIHIAVGQTRHVTLGRWPLYGDVQSSALEPERMS